MRERPAESVPRLARTALAAAALCSALGCDGRTGLTFVPDASVEIIPDAGPDAGPGAGPDAGSPDAGPAPLTLRAGAARIELVPAAGSPLAGFGAAPRRLINAVTIPEQLAAANGQCLDLDPSTAATYFAPNQGTLDPLYVRALVIDDGARRMAILKVDAIGFSREIRDDLLPLAASLGIPPELLVGAATHTHSGAGAVSRALIWELIAADCFNARAYAVFLDTMKRALAAAVHNLAEARLGAGAAQDTSASENRRGRPGVFDPEMGILKLIDAEGKTIAAVMNFAIHGTVHGADNLKFSADVMGQAELLVEEKLGGMALFLNGAEGDVRPAHGLDSGRMLAETLAAAWPAIATSSHTELQGAFEDVTMPRLQYNVGCVPIPGSGGTLCDLLPGVSVQVPLDPAWAPKKGPFQAIRLGDTVLAMVPGEPITELGWEIKARGAAQGFAHTFVVGLANDHLSYFTTRAEYLRGLYEGTASLYGPGNGALVVDAAERVMIRARR